MFTDNEIAGLVRVKEIREQIRILEEEARSIQDVLVNAFDDDSRSVVVRIGESAYVARKRSNKTWKVDADRLKQNNPLAWEACSTSTISVSKLKELQAHGVIAESDLEGVVTITESKPYIMFETMEGQA